MSNRSTSSSSSVLELAQRCRNLLGERSDQKAISIPEAPQMLESETDSPGDSHLSLSQIFIPLSKAELNAYDYICITSVESAATSLGARASARIHVIGPDSLMSHSLAHSSGLMTCRISLSTIRPRDCRLCVALFKIKRNPGRISENRRIIEAIENLASALDHERDPIGSMALACSIIDRVELLSASPEVSLLIGGTHVLPKDIEGRIVPHHAAFLRTGGDDQSRELRVKDGTLCVVSRLPSRESGDRSPEATSEWREQEFLLVRVGRRPERVGSSRSIDELRRQQALVQTSLSTRDQDVAFESYHEKAQRIRVASRLNSLYGQTGMQRIPAVTPIAIEAAANLRPLLQGNEGELEPQFAQHLADMRAGLTYLFGVEVPLVRVRINDTELPDGTYIIIVREIPLVSGNLALSRGLCNETVDRLMLLNVKGEAAVNPANGSECSWVDQGDWQRVRDAGLQVWSPKEYIVLHLSAVIRKNLPEFVGIQAVAELLKQKTKERYSKILSAQGGLPRFTNVIQALLMEEVPVKELPSICDCHLESQNLPTYEIPEEIRSLKAVRKDVMGNTPDNPIYRLGDNLVALIEQGIQRDGEAAVLALEPEPTQETLTAVRNEVSQLPPTSRNPVLFVEDWRMRSFVRKLIELEFPHLPVLSRREALNPDSMPVLATIEVQLPTRIKRR